MLLCFKKPERAEGITKENHSSFTVICMFNKALKTSKRLELTSKQKGLKKLKVNSEKFNCALMNSCLMSFDEVITISNLLFRKQPTLVGDDENKSAINGF